MTIVTPPPAIDRDRYGRPLVVPPTGGKPVPYSRCTSFIDVIEDKFKLTQWKQRMVALGLASRPALLLSVNAHREDKDALNRICDDAREAAAANDAATTGTALHALTELIDRGQELPVGLPDDVLASLDAYREATKDLKAVHIERFMVLDSLQIGGTPDRVVKYKSKTYIADVKTGTIELGALKIASQLAVYARSHLYDVTTHERSEHGADLKRGIIIHLPAGTATCTLHWVDLEAGWQGVITARDVRERRKATFKTLTEPFEAPPFEPKSPADEIRAYIAAATTPEAVRGLWATYEAVWTDDLTTIARERVAELSA